MIASPVRVSLFLLSLLIVSCSRPAAVTPANSGPGCIENFDPQKDYFPHKAVIEYAGNFKVAYHKSYKVVTVPHPNDTDPEENYVLVQCGAPLPALSGKLAAAPVISIPIRSMFAATATQLPLLVELGRVDVVTGVGQAMYVTTEPVLERIQQGYVVEYAPNDTVNTELVISHAPALLMTSGGYRDAYSTLRKAGIPLVANAEWLETTGLGRAEWIKYMALFLNAEAKAQETFTTVRDRYLALLERTRDIKEEDRPRVMSGTAFRGMFNIAGGRSYVAKMIRDAGAVYVWEDNTSAGGASVDMEQQIARASDADFWINGDGSWASLQSMLAEDRRYAVFKPFKTGNVWLYNRIRNKRGGLDYWARGITRPDLILADMIKIFHPELATDHEFQWYKQLPRE